MNRLFRTIVLSATLLAGATVAYGQSQTWVTYAYDSKTGRWGLSWGRTDRQAAMNEALSRCAAPGCKLGTVQLYRCVAVATGTSPGPGFAYANDAEAAKRAAIGFCSRGPSGSTCEVDSVRCAN